MRLLVNENIPSTAIGELRRLGHDVSSVKEQNCGETDARILALAQFERRVVVTQDKDFGELAFRNQLPADCGVILFRLSGGTPQSICTRIVDSIQSRDDWAGHFAVVDDQRVRLRPLPTVRKAK